MPNRLGTIGLENVERLRLKRGEQWKVPPEVCRATAGSADKNNDGEET